MPVAANDDSYSISENGGTASLAVLANDAGGSLTIISADILEGMGSVQIAADGQSILFDPAAAYDYLRPGMTATVRLRYIASNGPETDPGFVTLTITGSNDRPIVTTSAGTTTYTEGSEAAIDIQLRVSDPDNQSLATATVQITSGYQQGQDILSLPDFVTFGKIVANFDAATGTLHLSVGAGRSPTMADWQMALGNVRFNNSSGDPIPGNRTLTILASDGIDTSLAASKVITVGTVNTAPSLDLNGAASGTNVTTPYVEQAPAIAIAPDAVLADPDSSNFDGGVLTISYVSNEPNSGALTILNGSSGAGQIGVSGNAVLFGGVQIGTFSGGANLSSLVVSLNGAANVVAVQALLRAIGYSNPSDTPGYGVSLSITLTDGDGGTSAAATAYIPITAVNDALVIDLNGAQAGTSGALTYRSQSPLTAVAPAATLADTDVSNFAGGRFSVRINQANSAEGLEIINQGTGDGQISISGDAVIYEGLLIGRLSGSPANITVLFDVQFVPLEAVEALVRAIGYRSSFAFSGPVNKTVIFSITEPGVQTPSQQSATVTIEPPLTGITGDNGDNLLIGTDQGETLSGLGGNDVLIGGLGADLLNGGDGNDTVSYQDDHGAVFANLHTRQGSGNAAQGDSYSSIENLIGSSFDDLLIGSWGDNRLDGAAGDDMLIGSLGADMLVGGQGIDTASYEDNWGSVAVNLTLGRGYGNAAEGDVLDGIENLRGGAFADFFIGNEGVNRLDGGAGDDTLIGGLGADILYGEAGSDTASYEDNSGSVAVNLTLGRGYGNAAEGDFLNGIENLRGGMFADFFIGDERVNRLDGGAGDDTLIGGLGADLLFGDAGSDTASYEDNSGSVAVNLTLGRGYGNAAEGDLLDGIENLRGGVFADFFIGDAGANQLNGRGGADTLIGAGGADRFLFDTSLGNGNIDRIEDFASGQDRIVLDRAVFAGIEAGGIGDGAFRIGTAAADADDRILFDSATGALWFDADGNGIGAAVQFAVIQTGATVVASDFMVI